MYAALKNQLYNWIFRPRGLESGSIVLVQRRVFILPTRQGIVFGAVLVLMLIGAINYGLSLGFVLTFLLVAMGFNAMIYTFRNLANLRIYPGRTRPVFAGEHAQFAVCLANPGAADRYSIGLTSNKRDSAFVDVPGQGEAIAAIGIRAVRRGILRPGRLTLYTRYPLGLYYAWAYLELDLRCIVYPRLAPAGLPLPPAESSAGQGAQHGQGQEDFSGLRQYHLGDSPRHIAWKAAARDRGLLTKQFSGRADSELWLDWRRLPPGMNVEEKLSCLTRWVVDAHALGMAFGLRIPGKTIALGAGDLQRDRCLEALALHGIDENRDNGSDHQSA
ncbi:MAG: DUF58 domain-containing protein [Betaproteobacteria bacterium]|nr:DUF58 domain-containing protein [Betaproteobacteria bacterium]